MNLTSCVVEDCGDRVYAKGKCKKHYLEDYRKKKRYSLNKECDGICIPKRVVMDKSRFCKSCIQKALRGTLVKQQRTNSGATIFTRWHNKGKVWKVMGLNILDANRVIQELIQQQGYIIDRSESGDIIQIRKKVKLGTLSDGRVIYDTDYIVWD